MRPAVRVFAAIALTAMVGVSACAKKNPVRPPVAPAPAPAPAPAEPPRTTPATPPPPPRAPEAAPRPLTEDEIFRNKSLEDVNREKPLTDAFFALDSAQVGEDSKSALQKDAEWMKRWSTTKVMIEGHADSRGTAEYNLALGERRATALRDYLVNLGLGVDRITVVSKGKEAPFCTEENESCWQQNRRGHFVVTAK